MRNQNPIIGSALSAAFAALPLLGCSRGPELEPAESANTAAYDTAYTTVGDVVVTAKGDAWPGDSDVREYVTPVRIAIRNGGQQPLSLRYSAMSLVSADGETFRALPPFDVSGTVEKTVDRLIPRFEHNREIAVAPYLGYVYEGLEVEAPARHQDRRYYDELYDNWQVEIPLPTQYMQEAALPEALVRPRGELSGYVYFERVPSSKQQVTLTVDLLDADTGASIGTARIPFVID